MTRITKGSFGYLKAQKKYTIYRTVIYFSLSLAIFILGWATTGSKANLLTIAAMLGMLPASKSAVNMILFLRTRDCPEEVYSKINSHAGGLPVVYELYLTSYSKNFPLLSAVVKNNTFCGYTDDPNCDTQAASKHIADILMQNKLKPTIKLFNDLPKYCKRLDELKASSAENSSNDSIILEVVKEISL